MTEPHARLTERMSFTVPVELKRRMKQHAAEQGITFGEYGPRATGANANKREAPAAGQQAA